jgi:hypothetical protein
MNQPNSTCGICDFSNCDPVTIRNCSICQGHLCIPLQTGPRTVCSGCIYSNRHQLDKIFVNGKDENMDIIDPGSLQVIPTCKECGCPKIPLGCSLMSGCSNKK